MHTQQIRFAASAGALLQPGRPASSPAALKFGHEETGKQPLTSRQIRDRFYAAMLKASMEKIPPHLRAEIELLNKAMLKAVEETFGEEGKRYARNQDNAPPLKIAIRECLLAFRDPAFSAAGYQDADFATDFLREFVKANMHKDEPELLPQVQKLAARLLKEAPGSRLLPALNQAIEVFPKAMFERLFREKLREIVEKEARVNYSALRPYYAPGLSDAILAEHRRNYDAAWQLKIELKEEMQAVAQFVPAAQLALRMYDDGPMDLPEMEQFEAARKRLDPDARD